MKPLHLIGIKTPKEKADELVKIFSQYSAVRILELNEYNIQRKANATQCAILCVEEIINHIKSEWTENMDFDPRNKHKYWNEVKDELLKTTSACQKCNGNGWVYRDAITTEKINCICKTTK